MSTLLWKYFFENDVQKFRQALENAAHNQSAGSSKNNPVGRGGNTGTTPSPGTSLSTSPTLIKGRRAHSAQSRGSLTLSRVDVNWQDHHGVTLLHYIAASTEETAFGFAQALLEVPFLDLYIQDAESGWTALHRALYFGNVSIARALLSRDLNDAVGHSHIGTHQGAGGLIKIKDHEGKSPFDVYAATITTRVIHQGPSASILSGSSDSEDDDLAHGVSGDNDDDRSGARQIVPSISLNGDQVFAFGSNKNFTLGFGDEDDRQYPERVNLTRPDHLLQRLNADHEELLSASAPALSASPTAAKSSSLPALVQHRPIIIQDVQLSKLHSSILTTDPEANLYMCGFGSGGRLGTGDETTRFHYVPVFGGGLMGKKVIQVGLGQNHSIAISSQGEVFTWGSNAFGQLGYASATPRFPNEEPVQLLPRQIFGPLKREAVIGAAASRIHSVVYTSNSLYTFGKNDGQLGLVDSDARSLTVQSTPRKVAAALFTSSVNAVSAIDMATVCLLENHDVWVFANYGYTKLTFPLESFSNYFLRSSYAATRYNNTPNEICKITAGGDTVCALSSMGDVFTAHVTQNVETTAASTSTTNPSKIRGALSPAQRVWSMNRGQMAVKDVDVGQDGSVIICTDSGSVWRRVKRAKIKDTHSLGRAAHKSKDYKFSRVPGLTKITAVRSNAFGAYAAIRKDSDVLKSQIGIDSPGLWRDLYPLLPLQSLSMQEDPNSDQPAPRFWVSARPRNDTSSIRRAVLAADNLEQQLPPILGNLELSDSSAHDLRIGSTACEVVFPVHEFVLAGRSEIMRRALMEFRQNYFFSMVDVMTIEYDSEGKVLVKFQGADLLTVLNVVLYIYTDSIVDVWHQTRHAPKLASKYRQVRLELMKIAAGLEMKNLEQAVRLMVEPSKTLHNDFGRAIRHPDFFDTGDIEVKLDGQSMMIHSAMICQRCPFFEGLFHGRAAGAWLSSRRGQGHGAQERVEVDLKHIDPAIFEMVLQYLYADADEEIFNHVITPDFDAFLDLIMEVMSVANELMLDRLAQCCQKTLGRYVNMRNVCQLLNAIAPCSVTEFKNAALEYICLNLEGMLENHLLDELDGDLMCELDEVVRQNQLACLPFAKSGRAEAQLIDRYPGLRDTIERSKRTKIDSLALRSRLRDEDVFYANAAKAQPISRNDDETSSSSQRRRHRSSNGRDAGSSNHLKQKTSNGDLMFAMEEDDDQPVPQGDQARTSSFEIHPSTEPRTPAANVGLVGSSSMNAITPERHAILGNSNNPDRDSLTQASEYAPSPSNIRMTSGAWGPSTFESSKLTMKEIMNQASLSSRTSNLSSGLALKARNTDNVSSGSAAKLSQRERKRQQQQAQLQQHDRSASPEAVEQTEDEANLTSPWQVAGQGPKVSLKDVLAVEATKSPSLPAQKAGRQASAPPLTLRQTVPGKAPAPQRPASGGSHQQQQQQQGATIPKRSVSTPSAIKKPSAAPLEGSSTPSPSVHSIRHAPPPVEPSLQLSMADILAQQQIEKDVIKEAGAKRSLQEIQEEQAFQEWWDQESKKVQEEEEAARGKTAGPRGGRSSGGGGRSRSSRGRGRGRGRGAPHSTENATEQAQRHRSGDHPSEERGGKSRGRRDARRDLSEGEQTKQ